MLGNGADLDMVMLLGVKVGALSAATRWRFPSDASWSHGRILLEDGFRDSRPDYPDIQPEPPQLDWNESILYGAGCFRALA